MTSNVFGEVKLGEADYTVVCSKCLSYIWKWSKKKY